MNSAFSAINNPQTQPTSSAFGSVFGQANPSTSAFGQIANNTSGFGSIGFDTNTNTNISSNTLMSTNTNPMKSNQDTVSSIPASEYTKEDIEAFQSANFVFGQIPELEPPLHLRMRQ
jgi:hypothetical protein